MRIESRRYKLALQKKDTSMKKNYRPITALPSVSKFMKDWCKIKCYRISPNISSKVSYPHSFVDFERAMVDSMHCYVLWKPAR